MGVYGVCSVIEDGLDLRRDCELIADEPTWTVRSNGPDTPLDVTLKGARNALETAKSRVTITAPLVLNATKDLAKLLERV